MSLRQRTLFLVGLSGILLTVSLYVILSNVFSKSFQKLEYDYVEAEVLSVLDAFSGIMDELKSKSADWSAWDDSYDYVHSKDPKFLKSNLTNNAYLALKLNHIVLLNNKGEFVYRHAHDLVAGKEVAFPQSLERVLRPDSPLLNHTDVDSIQAGLVVLPEGLLLLVSRPIVTSLKEGPIRGSIVFGRYLGDKQIEQLGKMTQHVLMAQRYDTPNLPPDFEKARQNIHPNDPVFVQPLSHNTIAGYSFVNDIFGAPALIIRMDQPRSIYQQGVLTLRYLVLSVILTGLVTIIVILFLLEKLILSRLKVMNDEVQEIATKGNLAERISDSGKDELGVFARTLNHTLEQLEKTQIQIKNSEEWFRILFEYAPDGIFLNDSKDKLLDANRKTLLLLGKSKEETLGKSLKDLQLLVPQESDSQKKKSIHELFFPASGENGVVLEIQNFPITFKDQNITLNIARDITERKSLEKMKEEFIFTVSHELRTPLSIVKAFLGNLQAGTAGELNEKQSELLETCIRNVNRLTRLINDILDFSRLESGKAKINRKASAIVPLLEETLDNFKEKAKTLSVQLLRELPRNLDTLYIDPDMIVQVVFNLLDNAFRFAKSQVKLSCELKGDNLEIIIADDGQGISEEGLLLLFNKFQQIDRPMGGAGYKGTGLGLVICKEIIHLHQGKIWAESKRGAGASFHFTLPLAPQLIKRENNE